jgi:hypothetical protein
LANEKLVIDEGIRAVEHELENLRQDESEKIARSLWGQHVEILKNKLRAAKALEAATAAERRLVVEMVESGYLPMPGTLVSPHLAAATALGSIAHYDAPINQFARALQAAGVLP